MFTLFSEIHFWTLKENVQAQDSDLGAFRYHDKKTAINSILGISKRQYSESRGITWVNSNKRPTKLRDTLRELEDLLDNQKVIYREWCNSLQLQLMFHTGIFVTITVNAHTADISHIQIDKYLLNKLLVEHLTHVIITNQHALCSYNENQITLIHFNKPTLKSIPSKWHHLEPRLAHLSLAGPSGRRIERKLSANVSGDMVLSWWRCTRDEVYPWSPVVKDVDRANIHVYSLTSVKLELLCYYKTDSDPLCVEFSHVRPNIIHSVEQKISRRGEVSVESCTYEILNGKCHRIAVTCIPLETNVCCHSFSPDNRHLLLGCIDGSLVLHDIAKGVTHLVKSAFIPSLLCWNSFGCAITVANEKCQIQFFDSSLSCIKVQFTSEDITPGNILDLGSYFKTQPTLLDIRWHQKPSHHTTPSDFAQTDALLMLFCEKGPLCVLKILGCAGLSASVLISQYMSFHQSDQAVSLLRSLDWDLTPALCLTSLQTIVNHLLRQNLTPEIEVQLESALASFLAPVRGFSSAVEAEFADPVRDLTRRFLYCLLRHGIIDKALQVALDLEEADALMDVHHSARALGHLDLAHAALEHALDIGAACASSASSSCSCSDSEESEESFVLSSNVTNSASNNLPPLPKPKVKFSDTVTAHIIRSPPSPSNNIPSSSSSTHLNGHIMSSPSLDSSNLMPTPSTGNGHQIPTTSWSSGNPKLNPSLGNGNLMPSPSQGNGSLFPGPSLGNRNMVLTPSLGIPLKPNHSLGNGSLKSTPSLGIPLTASPSTSIVYQTPLQMKFDEEESKKIKVVHFGVV